MSDNTFTRCFIALEPDTNSRTALQALQQAWRVAIGPDAGLRWTAASQLHMTLRFLGDVEAPRQHAIAEGLARLATPLPSLAPQRIEYWPSLDHPRLLVLRLEQPHVLQRLVGTIDELVLAHAIPVERRPFAAHVTLARLAAGGATTHPESAAGGMPVFTAAALVLYASIHDATGACYRPLRRLPIPTLAG